MRRFTLQRTVEIYDNDYLPVYRNDLKDCGIKLVTRPCNTSGKISQHTFVLMYLLDNIGVVVSKRELTEQYEKISGKKTNDLQAARHLGTQSGYDITNSRGGIKGYCLNSLSPKDGFIFDRREIVMTKSEWISLKLEYENKCATCADEQGKPTRYDKSKICKLQMGHMNPKKALTLDNTIPHCEECNSVYKDKWIFNKLGKVLRETN